MKFGRKNEAAVAHGPRYPREFGRYVAMAQVGLEMVVPVGVGVLLDHFFGWSPWATVVGAVLGLVGGLAHLIALSSRHNHADSPKPPRDDS